MPTTKKSAGAKSASSKSSAKKAGTSKTTKAKSGSSKSSAAKSGASKSTAARSTSAKSSATKSSGPKRKASSSSTKSSSKKAAPAKTRAKSKAASSSKRTTAAKSPRSATSKRGSRSGGKDKGIIAKAVDAVAGMFAGGSASNAVELLKTDHRKVESLFETVKANEDGNNAATFKKIKEELDVHAHVEEMIFYPHLLEKGDKELKKIVREGVEEHTQVKALLTELAGLSGDSPIFKAKITVLMENVEHHVEEEEDEMFPMVEDQIPEETLQRLGSLMQGEKIKVKKTTAPPSRQKAKAATQR